MTQRAMPGPVGILLVEDNPGDARLMKESLAGLRGARVDLEHVTSLGAGLDRLDEGGVDAILLDLDLPDSTGIETFERVNAAWPGIPIIVLTGNDDEILAEKTVREGAQDYLLKGLPDGELLWRSIRYAIERKRIEAELDRHRAHLERLVEQRTSELSRANERLQMENDERQKGEEALRASLEEKEILLRELAHRTKNNMNAISSIIGLQTAGIPDEKMRETVSDIQERIRAMSLVHELLYRSHDLSTVTMRDYIGDLVYSLLRTHQGRCGPVCLNLDVDDFSCSIDATLTCGLIISELVSNSLKHAFPPEKPGAIFLSFRQGGEGMELRYSDNGPGLPRELDLARIPSLGLKLVRNIAVMQLQGKMEVVRDPATEFVFSFGSFAHMEKV